MRMLAAWMALVGPDEYDVNEDGGEQVARSMDDSK